MEYCTSPLHYVHGMLCKCSCLLGAVENFQNCKQANLLSHITAYFAEELILGVGREGHPSCSLYLKWKSILMIAGKFWPSLPKQGCLCFHNIQESNKLILNDLEEKLSGIYQVRSGETKQFWKKAMANHLLLPRKVNGYVHEITKGQVSLEGLNHRSLRK